MPSTKESTARISMFRQLKIPFVFTLEASFAGASVGSLAGQHFSQQDLMNVGRHVLFTIWKVKKLTFNKNLLKVMTAEAQEASFVYQKDDRQNQDSDEASTSEEEESAMPSTIGKKNI